MWMFIWLNEEVAKCYAVYLLLQTTWRDYLRHVCAGSSAWTSMLELSSLHLHAWQVMLVGRQHPHLLLYPEICVREGWRETSAVWQAGDFPSRAGLDLLVGSVTPLGWEAALSPLDSSDLCCLICHVLLLHCCGLALFCLLFCHCLRGPGRCICIWSRMLDMECIRWIFSLRPCQGGLLRSIEPGVRCHVTLMLPLPGESVSSVFCRCIVSASILFQNWWSR